jgi:hypothetical protein
VSPVPVKVSAWASFQRRCTHVVQKAYLCMNLAIMEVMLVMCATQGFSSSMAAGFNMS